MSALRQFRTSAQGRKADVRDHAPAGEFNLGLYSGALEEVRSINPLITQADYQRMRLGWSRNAILETALSPIFLTLAGWIGLGIVWGVRRLR